MGRWLKIGFSVPPENSLVILYKPNGDYIFISGNDYEKMVKANPEATHYCIVIKGPHDGDKP